MDDKTLIKETIMESYIMGVHTHQDQELAGCGFHPEFRMVVRYEDRVEKVDLSTWLESVRKAKEEDPDFWNGETGLKSLEIDVASNAAVAKMDVYKNNRHFSTDFMLLYKMGEAWQIVSKIFALPSPA